MVVDSSAVIAILPNEAGARRFALALNNAPSLMISAASVLEISIVLDSRFGGIPVEIAVVTRHQVEIARAALPTSPLL